jgi:hypothetical protein
MNRGGDRQLNRALHTIVMLRQTHHGPTRVYTSRRIAQGKSQRETGQLVKVVRRVRDDIDGRARRLLAELVPTGA